MTTIVAVRKADQIVMGSDSLLTMGGTRMSHRYEPTQKIHVLGHSCIGFAGSVAHYPAVMRGLREIQDKEPEKFSLRSFDAVYDVFTRLHKKMKDELFLNPKKAPEDPYESSHFSLMIANGSGVYGVYGHREIMQYQCFWANGSGRPFALGAMHAVYEGALDAASIAKTGLSAGMEFDPSSAGEQRIFIFTAGEDAPPRMA